MLSICIIKTIESIFIFCKNIIQRKSNCMKVNELFHIDQADCIYLNSRQNKTSRNAILIVCYYQGRSFSNTFTHTHVHFSCSFSKYLGRIVHCNKKYTSAYLYDEILNKYVYDRSDNVIKMFVPYVNQWLSLCINVYVPTICILTRYFYFSFLLCIFSYYFVLFIFILYLHNPSLTMCDNDNSLNDSHTTMIELT